MRSKWVFWVIVAVLTAMFTGCIGSVYVESAKEAMSREAWDQAKGHLLEGTAQTPDDPEVWYLLGEVYFKVEKFDSMMFAFKEAEELTDKHDSDIDNYQEEAWRKVFNGAVKPFNNGEYEKALDQFQLSHRIDPSKYESLKFMGITQMRLGNLDDATEAMSEALSMEQGKDDLDLHFSLLNLYWQKEEWENVVDESKVILAMPADSLSMDQKTDAISKKAFGLYQADDLEGAIAAWDEAIETNPDYADFYFNKGILLIQAERPEDAIEPLTQAFKLNPEDTETWEQLVSITFNLQEWDTLIDIMEQKLFPDGEVKVYDPEYENENFWKVLRAAYLNTEQMDKAKVVSQIIEENL